MSKYSRKDYVFFANMLNHLTKDAPYGAGSIKEDWYHRLAFRFQRDNPKFNSKVFKEYCFKPRGDLAQ